MQIVLFAGQALVDCIFSGMEEKTQRVESITLAPGGEAYNGAVNFSRLGGRALLHCGLGRDVPGRLLEAGAREAGVDLSPVVWSEKLPTPISGLFVDPSGERKSYVSRANDLPFFHPSLGGLSVAAATMSSLFRPPFLDPEICLSFAREVKESSALLLADTKMPRGTDPELADYRDLFPLLDFITPNETEAAYYTGYSDPRSSARALRELGVGNVIIKLGEKGCYVLTQTGEDFFLPAISGPVVDGIGAGDSFSAGLLLRLLEGASLREACRFATACASLTVAHRGATGGIRSRQQVEETLAAHPVE